MTTPMLQAAADPAVNLQAFTLADLTPFKREKSFDPRDSADFRVFYVGRDDVHGILAYLLARVSRSLKLNMFGYDDDQLDALIARAITDTTWSGPLRLPFRSITAWARASNFQHGRLLTSQWFPDKATSAQTNSRAPSVVLNQIDDLWSPSTFHRARDRRSSCRILACHLVAHAKLRVSCGAHPR